MEILLTILGIIAILYVIVMIIRSHCMYRKSLGSPKARNSEPYYYKSPKYQTTRGQDCGKTSEKP